MREFVFKQDEYKTIERLLIEGYQYQTVNFTLSRTIRGKLGWEIDIWLPQDRLYKRWFTQYLDLDLRVWYDDKIDWVKTNGKTK